MGAHRLVVAAAGAAVLAGACMPSPAPVVREVPALPQDVEVAAPLRGQYVWDPVTRWTPTATPRPFPQSSANPTTAASSPWPDVPTYYTRVAWSDLETSAGSRSGGFPKDTVLERRIAAAAARGQRTIFRVLAADPDTYSPTDRRLYPDYLAARVGEWRARVDGGRAMFVPDWNSPAYLDAATAMIAELGRRYDGDPRVAGFDISGYGTWGEWNDQVWGPQLPPGRARLSDASMRRLVDTNLQAFPTTQLFALTDPSLLRYVLGRSRTVGLRVDCLGQWSGGGAWERILAVPGADQRWRTAPVATEYCASNYGVDQVDTLAARLPFVRADAEGDLYENAVRQVARWHVSLVSSGNHPGAGAGAPMTSAQIGDFARSARDSGYRYRVAQISRPAGAVRAGDELRLRATWVNDGVAPAYGGPRAELQLRLHGSSRVLARTTSTVDLAGLVDRGISAVAARADVDDVLALPPALAAGRYDLTVVVRTDISGVTTTLPLAQHGRASDGAYVLDTFDVAGHDG